MMSLTGVHALWAKTFCPYSYEMIRASLESIHLYFPFLFPVRYLHKTLVISVKTILELEGIINIGLSIFDQRILLTFVLCLSYIYNSRLKRTNVFFFSESYTKRTESKNCNPVNPIVQKTVIKMCWTQ